MQKFPRHAKNQIRFICSISCLLILGLFINGCSAPNKETGRSNQKVLRSNVNLLNEAQKTEVEQLAISKLSQINAKSILDNREFCGYIGMRSDRTIASSSILGGELESCEPNAPSSWTLLASFHSHGAYTADLNSEYPSSDDVLGDYYDRTIGYISTPGGRVWKVDGQNLSADIICEKDCVVADKEYDRASEQIRPSVSLEYLQRLEQSYNP